MSSIKRRFEDHSSGQLVETVSMAFDGEIYHVKRLTPEARALLMGETSKVPRRWRKRVDLTLVRRLWREVTGRPDAFVRALDKGK